jgi:holo-[acyl-carrier protein] synthase
VTGVGLDLLEIDRLARALERRPRLAERLFTEGELAFAAERGEPARHLAVRFCAKEAVAKALALRDGDWHDVEVLGGGDGPPAVRLSGRARERAAELGVEVEISLTHSKNTAGAVAMLLVPPGSVR